MTMDWKDLSRTDKLEFVMVSPQSMDQTLGTLEDVILSKTNVSSMYYTDTRTSASISFMGPEQYIRNSLIRIVHRIPEWGYSKELGTYLVRANPMVREKGTWTASMTLESRLEGLALNLAKEPWTVASGAYIAKAMQQMLSECGVQWRFDSMNDKKVNSAFVYETGGSYLSRLYDLCSLSNNRLDVDPHGIVTVGAYTAPSAKAPSYRIDLADIHGLAADGITLTSTYMETPNRAIVSYRYSESVNGENVEREITAHKDSTGNNSITARGYVVADYYSVSELEPATYATALNLATSRLMNQQKDKVEWEVTMPYFPVWEGDVVELIVHDGPAEYQGARHCLVKSQKISLDSMSMDLVLKETASGDEE